MGTPPETRNRSTGKTTEAKMTNTIQTAKELTFGTELEYTNISRERAVKAIHSVGGGTIRHPGMHQPARPYRSPRFHRPADRELRADFLQAGRASPQGGRNASAANRQLHTAHRPRIHRPAGKSQAHHAGGAQQGMVRIFKSESRSLRFHAVLWKRTLAWSMCAVFPARVLSSQLVVGL